MSWTVLIEPLAEDEWQNSMAWYEEQEAGVGARFNETVRHTLLTVAQDPGRFPLVGLKARKAKIIGWPYSVYFTIDAPRREVRVLAIWYGAQSPAKQRGTYRIFGAYPMTARLAEWSVRLPVTRKVPGSNRARRRDFCALFSEGRTFRAVLSKTRGV